MATWPRESRNLVGRVLTQGRVGVGEKAESRNRIERVSTELVESLSSIDLMKRNPFALRTRLLEHVGGNVDGVQLAIWQSGLELGCNPTRTGREVEHSMWCEAREDIVDQRLF
jgi:hypothetical protein